MLCGAPNSAGCFFSARLQTRSRRSCNPFSRTPLLFHPYAGRIHNGTGSILQHNVVFKTVAYRDVLNRTGLSPDWDRRTGSWHGMVGREINDQSRLSVRTRTISKRQDFSGVYRI
ncbi:hypothetical protein QQF64_017990 [Cirrhinus molitorella]|uniref:MHC class I antigen n=1 Tax=Cirrhinus molitorella TaxID=172907 RepID=A0ABR3LK68_9TELE